MADTPRHSVSVAGIVVDDQDRVLVIQRRDNHHWEPPGGVLELGETPEQGVKREVFEETGLHVAVDNLSGVYKNMTLGIVSLVFRCHAIAGRAESTDEAMSVCWRTLEQVTHDMLEAYAIRVADAFLNDVQVRSHDGSHLLECETV